MQALVDEKKRIAEEALTTERGSEDGDGLDFPFHPARARSVPDFRRIQKAFITKMERKKKGKNPTIPRPFKFNQARPSAKLRSYMDQQNQVINPTLTKKRSYSVGNI